MSTWCLRLSNAILCATYFAVAHLYVKREIAILGEVAELSFESVIILQLLAECNLRVGIV